MTKTLTKTDPAVTMPVQMTEDFGHLLEEVQAIITERRKTLLEAVKEMKWEVGEAIATSPLYKKHAKGNNELIHAIARGLSLSSDTEIYACVNYYLKAPSLDEREAFDKELEADSWSKVKRALTTGHKETRIDPVCKHCPLHCTGSTKRQ